MVATPKDLLPDNLLAEMRPEKIGHRLYLLRRAVDLKPSEMADGLGISRTYWSRFENGNRAISDTVAALLVAKYGVTLDFLILGKWDKLPFDLASRLREIDAENSSSSERPS